MTESQGPSSNGRDYESAFHSAREEVRRFLIDAPGIIRAQTRYLAGAEGKNIRACSVLACAEREDGSIDAGSITAAAAVELLHLATLVHDDIIDGAEKRRGIRTLHRKFGEKTAVLCGDYLFSAAFTLAAGIKPPVPRGGVYDRFPAYLSRICLGELLQDQNCRNYKLSESKYFRIIQGKTAALFEASFHIGFLFSDEPESEESSYVKLGEKIGLIFQLCDDCADYESTQREEKKPVLSDYKHGVVTLPLIFSLKNDSRLREKIKGGMKPGELRAAVKKAGGIEYTRKKISALFSESEQLIGSIDTTQKKKDRLMMILQMSAGATGADSGQQGKRHGSG
ncbi:MAG: polyprenyl synthetase family protein [Clostridiales bacterium]|nr:polyprenyl synthetase family protein [Clostridiales bacterium]